VPSCRPRRLHTSGLPSGPTSWADATEGTIRLRTAYPENIGPDFATVVFEDVQGYVSRGDALGTILFEIESVDPLELYREHADQMQKAYANAGGHAAWAESESAAAAFLSAQGIRGYRISSSIGVEGGRLGTASLDTASGPVAR
jgi:hypothetical protein